MSLLSRVVARFKAWRHRRYWTAARQLSWLRLVIRNDHQWLGHDPVARDITDRYQKMLVEEWEKVSIEDARTFRERIGLKPDGGA